MEIVFLGTSAGFSIPAFYCNCEACKEAVDNSYLRRTRSSILLSGIENVLIDASPDMSLQFLSAGIKEIEYLVLTHWHYDHIGGLGDIEYYIRLHRGKTLPAFMSEETWRQIQSINSSITDCLDVQTIEPGQGSMLGDIFITALEATHAIGTLGYLIENKGIYTAYIPDTGPLKEETKERLQGIDYLILDATFWGKNRYPHDHLSFEQAVETGSELKVKKLYLTHLSMHYDTTVTNKELEKKLKSYNKTVKLAYDGLRIRL